MYATTNRKQVTQSLGVIAAALAMVAALAYVLTRLIHR